MPLCLLRRCCLLLLAAGGTPAKQAGEAVAPTGSEQCAWYRQPDVFSFGQFAVRPDLQGQGLGGKMIDMMETEAAARGARELALDTADGADHLIRWYEKRGYRLVEHVSWGNTNYRSVVMSKTLESKGSANQPTAEVATPRETTRPHP